MELNDGMFYRSVCAKEESEKYWIEEVLTDPNYFDWLRSFTYEHEGFNDGKWLHYNSNVSDNDKKQINKLHLLYKGIYFWAEKNHIYPTLRGYDEIYAIKIDNIGYEIGVRAQQGLTYFCDRVQIKNKQKFIEFNDIINDIRLGRAVIIDERLQELFKVIKSLHSLGVPSEVIKDKVDYIFAKPDSHQKTKRDKK